MNSSGYVGGIGISVTGSYGIKGSPDTDVNDDAYWVVSSGNVGFGDGVNYDSYGKNHSPGTLILVSYNACMAYPEGRVSNDYSGNNVGDSYGRGSRSPGLDYTNNAYLVHTEGNVGNGNYGLHWGSCGRRPAFGIFPILFIIMK